MTLDSDTSSLGCVRFDDLVRGYLDDYALHGYRAVKSARSRVAQLRRRCGTLAAKEITSATIRRYQLERRQEGAATGTINRETSALSRMFRLAIRSGDLESMPTFPNA
jgi:site-specific recombinase XerD